MEKELADALKLVLEAVAEYVEYEYSGDPWEEDARAMGEMLLDTFRPKHSNREVFEKFRKAVEAAQQSVEPTECTECGSRLPDHFADCSRQPA